MNIFYALSEGRGRLTETNFSAFLAFLLNPHGAHGFADIFLRTFLKEIAKASGEVDRFKAALKSRSISSQVDLEIRYENRTVDIDIQIFDDEGEKLHHVVIENKINLFAANPEQLKDQFSCVQKILSEEKFCPITMVFLTPSGGSKAMSTEFDALKFGDDCGHKKAWIRWRNNSDEDIASRSVVDLIRELLHFEATAHIEPIGDYARHTLKAFVQYIEHAIQLPGDRSQVRSGSDENDVISQMDVSVDGTVFKISRFGSNVITAFDIDSNIKVPALPLLRKVNVLYDLKVPLERAPGKPYNTQQLGQKILDKLKESSTFNQ